MKSLTEIYKERATWYGDDFFDLYGELLHEPAWTQLVRLALQKALRVAVGMRPGRKMPPGVFRDSLIDMVNYGEMALRAYDKSRSATRHA